MKKIAIVLTLALVVAMAMPAMAANNLDVNGELEIENTKEDGGDSSTAGTLELYLNANPAENVTVFSEVDFGYNFDNDLNIDTRDVVEAWVNVDNAVGPIDLKAGRMFEAAADSMLYEFDTNEFARLAYDQGNIGAKFGHNIDTDGQGKVIFAEGKVTDLGLVDGVTLNYVEDNAKDYDGYTVKVDKKHSFGDASVMLGDANDAGLLDVNFKTATLIPGVNASVEYADVEEGFVGHVAQDSVLTDTALTTIAGAGSVDMIKPGAEFNITDKLNGYASYAMYGSENAGDHDYLDAGVVYDMADSTSLEVEYEKDSYDNLSDAKTITTELTTRF